MWALVLAAPPKWTTSKAPGCTPKDPSGRDMGCSNNPSTLTFHKDAIPHVPQEFIQSPAGAMHLETTPVPPPAPAGTVDPKRQWGGAPDGAAPGEPFVDADGAQ